MYYKLSLEGSYKTKAGSGKNVFKHRSAELSLCRVLAAKFIFRETTFTSSSGRGFLQLLYFQGTLTASDPPHAIFQLGNHSAKILTSPPHTLTTYEINK